MLQLRLPHERVADVQSRMTSAQSPAAAGASSRWAERDRPAPPPNWLIARPRVRTLVHVVRDAPPTSGYFARLRTRAHRSTIGLRDETNAHVVHVRETFVHASGVRAYW